MASPGSSVSRATFPVRPATGRACSKWRPGLTATCGSPPSLTTSSARSRQPASSPPTPSPHRTPTRMALPLGLTATCGSPRTSRMPSGASRRKASSPSSPFPTWDPPARRRSPSRRTASSAATSSLRAPTEPCGSPCPVRAGSAASRSTARSPRSRCRPRRRRPR